MRWYNIDSIQKVYAMVVGAVLVLLGLLGFVQAPILGIFGVNMAQNILHLVGGALGLWLGYSGSGKNYNMGLGIVAAVVAVLGLVPPTATLLESIFAINPAITWLHAGVAVVSLGVAFGVKE